LAWRAQKSRHQVNAAPTQPIAPSSEAYLLARLPVRSNTVLSVETAEAIVDGSFCILFAEHLNR
jgi:hypothetical protein